MAKVQIKSEQITPFGGIFSIMEQFDALLSKAIDSTLGKCCQQHTLERIFTRLENSRIKTFVFKYISVAAKWVKASGTYRLNIYTENFAYARAFNTGYD